jgi:hypothetical protein
MILWSNTIIIVVVVLSFWALQCVVLFCSYFWHGLLPLLMSLSSNRLGSNIKAILFANTAAVIAATAELPLLLRELLLPLLLLLCGGLFQNIYCCKYCICQHHCLRYYGCCHCRVAIVAACRRYHCGEKKRKSTMLYILISFHSGNEDGESHGEGNDNDDGNGDGDDLSLFVSWQQWDNIGN